MNQNIITALETEIKQLEANNGNKYKISSLLNAIKIIKKITFVITDKNQLENIRGIGNGILKRIDTVLQSTEENTEISNEHVSTLDNLIGFGSKKIFELNKIGIYTPEHLLEYVTKNTIKLSHVQKLGLKYALGKIKYQDKIPRIEVSVIINQLVDLIKLHDNLFQIIPCGSYRRNKPLSNDIDILLLHPEYVSAQDSTIMFTQLLHHLINCGFLIDHLTNNIVNLKNKYMGFVKSTNLQIARRIDFHFVCTKSKYAALLYFTGSASFNREMRQLAKKKGFKLNEKCLMKNEQCIPAHSEKDIFDILEMQYISPEDR